VLFDVFDRRVEQQLAALERVGMAAAMGHGVGGHAMGGGGGGAMGSDGKPMNKVGLLVGGCWFDFTKKMSQKPLLLISHPPAAASPAQPLEAHHTSFTRHPPPLGPTQSMSCDPSTLDIDISDAPWFGALVNGKGYIDPAATAPAAAGQQPLVISVSKGKRYRMRVIGGMSSWALKVNVSGHSMNVIALDGRPVKPRNAQAVVVSSGERFDFVLTAGGSQFGWVVRVGVRCDEGWSSRP